MPSQTIGDSLNPSGIVSLDILRGIAVFGILLMTERMENSGGGLKTAEIHFRRVSWLMLFGVIHWALLLWTGEILFLYSLCVFLLFAVRKLPAPIQFAIGIIGLLYAAYAGN